MPGSAGHISHTLGQFCGWDARRGIYGWGALCLFGTGRSHGEPPSPHQYIQGLFIRPFCRNSLWGSFLPLWAWDDWLAPLLRLLMVLPALLSGPTAMSEMIPVTCLPPPASPPPASSSPSLPVKGVPPSEASSPSHPQSCFCSCHSAMEEQLIRGHGGFFGRHALSFLHFTSDRYSRY